MMMKVFPHGTSRGDKPVNYLIREDVPGRSEHPPEVLCGSPNLTKALINDIDRKWKFTSGVLAWHPDDKVSREQECEVMEAFERVAFAGLEPDQRYILWVRHSHAGHHELHFLIPRMELSSGKALNPCPPGWQKDFDVFRDLFNYRERWARPDDPERARDILPDKADLFHAQRAKWKRVVQANERDEAREAITEMLKRKAELGQIENREDVLRILEEEGLSITRVGKDYVGVLEKESGLRLRFKGGIFAEGWKPKREVLLETEPMDESERVYRMAELEDELERVIEKRSQYNRKRYPSRWPEIEPKLRLKLPDIREEDERNRKTSARSPEKIRGTEQQVHRGTLRPSGESAPGATYIADVLQRCRGIVHQLEELAAQRRKQKIDREEGFSLRM